VENESALSRLVVDRDMSLRDHLRATDEKKRERLARIAAGCNMNERGCEAVESRMWLILGRFRAAAVLSKALN